jgi:hypothetical protein
MIAIIPARKVDLTGGIALHIGRGNITPGSGHAQEFFARAVHSHGGRMIFALPSRNLKGQSNILFSVENFPNQFTNRESSDFIITEYGIASMIGRAVRKHAQTLIDISHPDDPEELIRQAQNTNILYADQIYLPDSGSHYPDRLACTHAFKGELTVCFRAVKPSDEEEMRKLFYRFSDNAVYYRYFSAIKSMPHRKMQEHVNIGNQRIMSIVGTVEESGTERLIAEGRYVRHNDRPFVDVAFVVDDNFPGRGVASFRHIAFPGHDIQTLFLFAPSRREPQEPSSRGSFKSRLNSSMLHVRGYRSMACVDSDRGMGILNEKFI